MRLKRPNFTVHLQLFMMIKQTFYLFVALLLATSCKYFKEQKMYENDIDTLLTEDTVTYAPEPVVVETPAPEPVVPMAPSKYVMVVGSFQDLTNAERYAEKVSGMGYKTEIIHAKNGYYRVSAQSYDQFKIGVNDIQNFRESVTPNAWLHVRK